jgi:hypothetical protein
MKKVYIKPTTFETSVSLHRVLLIPSTLIISEETVDEGLVKEENQDDGSSWEDIWD